jgi:hypothetical protein
LERSYRQKIIAIVTFIGGLYFFLEFILPKEIAGVQFGMYHDQISKGIQVVGLMAIGLGIINILTVHGSNILKTKKNWGNSLALILGLFAVLILQSADLSNSESRLISQKKVRNLVAFAQHIQENDKADSKFPPAQKRLVFMLGALESVKKDSKLADSYLRSAERYPKTAPNAAFLEERIDTSLDRTRNLLAAYEQNLDAQAIKEANSKLIKQLKLLASSAQERAVVNYDATSAKKASTLVFEAFYTPLGAAMFSLLAFYISTAAYRSFRIKSWEASVMMLAALIVMLGQIPHGPLYVYEDLPQLRIWLLKNISTPAFRAIYFGASIAGLAMAVRMWLSLERSPLSSDEGQSSQKGGA